jgi:hypothetical protein
MSTGFLPKIASLFGNNPALVAYVCRNCRHVDVWLDEAATLPEVEEVRQSTELSPA